MTRGADGASNSEGDGHAGLLARAPRETFPVQIGPPSGIPAAVSGSYIKGGIENPFGR
jgi:hypothetical protein